ncbi:MAG TPA: cation diffusion facilitator family transporter [Acidimicrobiales bacterium]|nr:cation diffusion facilitator family transporter [Acidimicrobiales bacterium]
MSTAHVHGHGHSHRPPAGDRAATRYKGRLVAALALLSVVTVVEVVAGFATRSLALVSDAGHMLTDVGGLGMALAAIHVADRTSPRRDRTFGLYRLEILAALANAVLLFGVATYVLIEAVRRWNNPADVLAGPMLVVAIVGLVANVVAFGLLRNGSKASLNVRGAYLEVMSDLLGSLGVILAAVVLQVTGWEWVDPVVGVAIGLFILPRAWRLGAQAVRILVQAAPVGTDLTAIEAQLQAIDGVVDVHDLHVWTLTSEMDVASVHLMVRDGTDAHGVLDRARVVLRDGHGIGHATLQVEPDTHEGCDELAW